MGIYRNDEYLRKVEQRIRNADYSEVNKDLIFKFESVLFAQGLSKKRILKYMELLNTISKWIGKDFTAANESDIYRIVGDLERSDRAEWTKLDYKQAIKRFFR